jgi:hypothetical protein
VISLDYLYLGLSYIKKSDYWYWCNCSRANDV